MSLRKHIGLAHQSGELRPYFELILAREDYDQSKPQPEPYLTALNASIPRAID